MHIYRFRIVTDAIDDFVREIDIAPSMTFEDFQRAILTAGPLPAEAQMVFYTANVRWVRLKEIGTQPLLARQGGDDDEDVRLENRRLQIPFTHMSVARLRDFVEDPHQRIIFEYYGADSYLFFVELIRIYQAENSEGLPKCVMVRGEVPVRPAQIIAEMQERQRNRKESARAAALTDLDDVSEDEIEQGIEEMLQDDTFSNIIEGKPAAAPRQAAEKPRKLSTREIAEEFGPEFADMMESDEDELEEEDEGGEVDDSFADSDEDFGGGRSGRRGGYDDFDY